VSFRPGRLLPRFCLGLGPTRLWVFLVAAARAILPFLLIDPTRAALCPYGSSVELLAYLWATCLDVAAHGGEPQKTGPAPRRPIALARWKGLSAARVAVTIFWRRCPPTRGP